MLAVQPDLKLAHEKRKMKKTVREDNARLDTVTVCVCVTEKEKGIPVKEHKNIEESGNKKRKLVK